MRGINSRKGAVLMSTCLVAASLLLLRATRNQPVTPGSSTPSGFGSESNPLGRMIAEYPPVELIDRRDDHTRVWEIVKEVEMTHPDGSRAVDTVKSYIHEKGSGLCYKDATGNYVPSVAAWREAPGGFVIDRCAYHLSVGKTLGSWMVFLVDGRRVFLRPFRLMASDGEMEASLSVVDPGIEGFIPPDSPSTLRFPAAFGKGLDLELVVEKSGFHHNLILSNAPAIPKELDPETAHIYLYTEINVDDYVGDRSCSAQVGPTPVDLSPGRLLTEPSASDDIIFNRIVRGVGGSIKEVPTWWFERSRVFDSSGQNETYAVRQLYTHAAQSYLVESTPYSFFDGALFPVVLDWVTKTGSISSSETWAPPDTYYISGSVTVTGSDTTLIIRPGTTVKYQDGVNAQLKVQSSACIKAEGTSYNYITLTSKQDDSCGEDLTPTSTTGSRADYRAAVELASTASDDSVVKYCKIGYPFYGIMNYIDSNNLAPFENNIISHGRYAIYLHRPVDVRNNLMIDCDLRGIYAYYYGTALITNNTIDGAFYGIFCYLPTLTAKYNIFSNCTYGARRTSGSLTLDYNAYWRNTYDAEDCTKGTNHETLGYDDDPYDSSPLGNFYLNDTAGAGQELKGKSCSSNIGFHKYGYTTEKPQTAPTSITTGSVTWEMVDYEDSTTTVDIGYHHNRVDWYVPSTCTVTGSGTSLTMDDGVVVAISGNYSSGYVLASSSAKITCVGDPLDEGANVITNSKSASTLIESPRISLYNPLLMLGSDASDQTAVQHAKMIWMFCGLSAGGDVLSEVKNNIFLLNYFGLYQGSTADRDLSNNLFYCNEYGAYLYSGDHTVANCTLDANERGIYSYVPSGSSLTVKDCLFTENDYGIYITGTGGNVEEGYNAFWENDDDYYPGSMNQGTDIALVSDPYDRDADDKYDAPSLWYLEQPTTPQADPQAKTPVDHGSYLAPDPLAGPHPYSTCRWAKRDVGRVDIGYHCLCYQNTDGDDLPDAWERKHFQDLDEGNASTNDDNDGLTALKEFWHGSSPDLPDTDGDAYNDVDEVGVQEPKKLVRGWGPAVYDFKAGPWLTNVTDDGVTIAWWAAENSQNPKVYYRAETSTIWTTVTDTGGPPVVVERDSGSFDGEVWESELQGYLTADTRYQYYVESNGKKSPLCRFRTLEALPSSFSFVVYGDNRGDDGGGQPAGYNGGHFNEYAAEVVRAILSKAPGAQFILHVGDFVEHGGDEEEWQEHFFQPTTRLIAEHPLFPVRGNHESSLTFYHILFDYPDEPGTGDYPTWYRFDYGDCYFVVMDSYTTYTTGSDQHDDLSEWLEETAEYTLFSGHHPPYNDSNGHPYSQGENLRTYIVPLLNSNNAEAHFAGHSHHYERWERRKEGDSDIDYFVIGGGGAPLHFSEGTHTTRKVKTESSDMYYNFGVADVTSESCTVTVWDVDDLDNYRDQHEITAY